MDNLDDQPGELKISYERTAELILCISHGVRIKK